MLKKTSILAGIFIVLFASRAYPETSFWDDFNENLEGKMNNRLIFNSEDYFGPPYLTYFDSPYGIKENKSLSKIENIIEEDAETSIILSLERYWRQKRIKFSDVLNKPKIGSDKETRKLEFQIKILEEELRDLKQYNRIKDTKKRVDLETQLRKLREKLAEKKQIELGFETALVMPKFSRWEFSFAPSLEANLGPTINKASLVYYVHSDTEKLKLETIILLPENIDFLFTSTGNLTNGDWESEIKIRGWLKENVFLNIGSDYFWKKETRKDFIGFTFIILNNLRMDLEQKYDWKIKEYLGQIMFRRDF